jgi:hypothetical protein
MCKYITFEVAFHIGDGVVGAATNVDMASRKPNLLQLGNWFPFLGQLGLKFVWDVPQRRAKSLAPLIKS